MIEINRQYQDRHIPGADTEKWVDLQEVERDICLLYHQLADYSYIMSDLHYGSVYGLDYWDYLNVDEGDPDREAFIREGCLVMIFAMLSQCICQADLYIQPELGKVSKAVEDCKATDERSQFLLSAVKLAIELASTEAEETAEFGYYCTKVHEVVVRQYFRDIARNFETNPYYGETE